jgi:hypothetical protein
MGMKQSKLRLEPRTSRIQIWSLSLVSAPSATASRHMNSRDGNLHFVVASVIQIWPFEVEVNLRPSVSRPVCLGVRRPSGTRDQFFFLFEISFRQLRVCYFVAPSLTRGRVCNLLYNCFWALPEQSLLGRNPAELTAIFYCLIWDSPNLEGHVHVFISPRNRVAKLYPRALCSLFVDSYDSQGYGGGILTRLHTGLQSSLFNDFKDGKTLKYTWCIAHQNSALRPHSVSVYSDWSSQ